MFGHPQSELDKVFVLLNLRSFFMLQWHAELVGRIFFVFEQHISRGIRIREYLRPPQPTIKYG